MEICCSRENDAVKELLNLHLKELLTREHDANKGTYGKLLIIAGSKGMAGAAYLSGLSAFHTGIGMVKYLGTENNRIILQTLLPEAMYESWESASNISFSKAAYKEKKSNVEAFDAASKAHAIDCNKLKISIDWADYVIIGPGLSKSDEAKELIGYIFEAEIIEKLQKKKMVIIDADGLNIIAEEGYNLSKLSESSGCTLDGTSACILNYASNTASKIASNIVITPHIVEMKRLISSAVSLYANDFKETESTDVSKDAENKILCKNNYKIEGSTDDTQPGKCLQRLKNIEDIKQSPEMTAKSFSELCNVNVVLKDSVSVVALTNGNIMKIDAGCSAMAKAGSGDALCGFIAGITAVLKGDIYAALPIAVYMHGTAGCIAAKEKGEHSILARDIAESAGKALMLVNADNL